MTPPGHQKVTASHLQRAAYLYVRQSTLRPVFENTESTQRQYALRESRPWRSAGRSSRWSSSDSDLGQSGASSTDRAGFQRLMSARSAWAALASVLGSLRSRGWPATRVTGTGCWRSARSTDTIAPRRAMGCIARVDFNGSAPAGAARASMSEAELNMCSDARLQRRDLEPSAARRAEATPARSGWCMTPSAPSCSTRVFGQVQRSLALLFATFERAGSASATVKHFRTQGVLLPAPNRARGPQQGELLWEPLRHWRGCSHVLHNPRYAGAFRSSGARGPTRWPGRRVAIETLPRDEWTVRLPDAHVGYITWDQFERNQQRLRDNASRPWGPPSAESASRGPGLTPRPSPSQGAPPTRSCGPFGTYSQHVVSER